MLTTQSEQLKFVSSFYDLNYSGFHVLMDKLKDKKNQLNQVMSVIKQRIVIEKEYKQKLEKLSNQIQTTEQEDSISNGLNSLKMELTTTSINHYNTQIDLEKQLHVITDFIQKQNIIRKHVFLL